MVSQTEKASREHKRLVILLIVWNHDVGNMMSLYNILYTVSTQHQYNDIMYAIGYTVATCFDRKRPSSGQ